LLAVGVRGLDAEGFRGAPANDDDTGDEQQHDAAADDPPQALLHPFLPPDDRARPGSVGATKASYGDVPVRVATWCRIFSRSTRPRPAPRAPRFPDRRGEGAARREDRRDL